MKEFIEKLIGRLEEEKKEAQRDGSFSFAMGFKVAISIANELAEEYKGKLDDEWQIIYDKVCVLEKKYTNERNIESVKDCIRLENLLQYFKEELRSEEKYINTSTDTSSGWIPCSEKMPKTNIQVIVTAEKCGHRYTTDAYFYNGKFYNKHYYKIPVGELNDSYVGDKVIAWQPLPEPYKEGSE